MNIHHFSPEEMILKQAITVSDAALEHIRKQMKKQTGSIGLRLGLKKAGCSGLRYQPEIVNHKAEDDIVFQVANDVLLLVKKSDFFSFLKGLHIDFKKQGMNATFSYENPNEKGSCGCGESFTI